MLTDEHLDRAKSSKFGLKTLLPEFPISPYTLILLRKRKEQEEVKLKNIHKTCNNIFTKLEILSPLIACKFCFFSVLFIIATSIFCIVVTGTLYHVYRTHVAYKRRKEAETTMLWRSQQIQYQEPPIPISPPIAKAVRSRSVSIISCGYHKK